MSIDPRLIPLRDDVAAIVSAFFAEHDAPADAANALLAPDGPLWPLLRALGTDAVVFDAGWPARWLLVRGIDGSLADACLAAAEVER